MSAGIRPPESRGSRTGKIAFSILAGAFLLRTLLMLLCPGYKNDVACFSGWSDMMVKGGPGAFYTSGVFADYPPGYLYLLWGAGLLNRLFQFAPASRMGLYIIGLPALFCDLGLGFLIYRAARPLGDRVRLTALSLAAFAPAFIFDTAVWKQVDSALILALCLCFLLLHREKYWGAAILYAAAILLKPQAFIFGPVFAVGFLLLILRAGKGRRALVCLKTAGCAVLCVGLVWLLALPFQGIQEPLWLVRRYLDTATYYSYGSVNAYNLFALLGGNWQPQSTGWLLSYGQWGTLFILLLTGALFWLAWRAQKRGEVNLPLLAAFYGIGVFTLAHSMHERYSLPAFALLLLAYALTGNRRLYPCVILQGICCFWNISMAYLCLVNEAVLWTNSFQFFLRVCSLLQTVSFLLLLLVCLILQAKAGEKQIDGAFARLKALFYPPLPEAEDGESGQSGTDVQKDVPPAEANNEKTPRPAREKKPFLPRRIWNALKSGGDVSKPPEWTHKDFIYMSVPTLICALLAFTYLGSAKVPETGWESGEESYVGVTFADGGQVAHIWTYCGLGDGVLAITDEDGWTKASMPAEAGQMYRWNVTDVEGLPDTVAVVGQWAVVNEMVFTDAGGNVVEPTYYYPEAGPMFDEQALLPDRPSQMTGMYFDEIYHGRTAYEHLSGISPYENTHPPLGKILIAIGISIFGMNPFGWRFVGALFGVLMIPMMYLFVRLLCKNREIALVGSLLFTFDCMRFVQSRIATVDVFSVFFIMASYYFMLRYLRCDFYRTPLRKQFSNLLFCGVFFGLASSVKWTGLYAGAGLAVLFGLSLWRAYWRFYEQKLIRKKMVQLKQSGDSKGAAAQYKRIQAQGDARVFLDRCFYTVLFCIFAFVLLPVGIYLASYTPYYLCAEYHHTLGDVWGLQGYMLGYHSQLTDTHPFESRWFEWPLILRPVWYYMGTMLPAGQTASITLLGNPLVWWAGLAAMAVLLLLKLRRGGGKSAGFLLIAFAAQFFPWALISRATFLYHYFPSLPFVILAVCLVLARLRPRFPKGVKWACILLVIGAALLFAFFYPALCGLPIPQTYAHLMEWLPRWRFFSYS